MSGKKPKTRAKAKPGIKSVGGSASKSKPKAKDKPKPKAPAKQRGIRILG